jgi:hypothetical protein
MRRRFRLDGQFRPLNLKFSDFCATISSFAVNKAYGVFNAFASISRQLLPKERDSGELTRRDRQ